MSFAEGFSAGTMFKARNDAQKEKLREESMEAGSLRKLLSLNDPNNKDQYTTMGLPELRGAAQSISLQKTLSDLGLDKERANLVRAQVDDIKKKRQNAEVLKQLIADAGTEMTTFSGAPGESFMGPLRSPTSGPITAKRLRELLPRYPDAVNAEGFPQTMNSLEMLLGSDEGGAPRILPGPFPNTKIVTDSRGRSTPQVVREEKSAEGYIEVPDERDPVYGPKIRLPLSQAQKDYPHLLERLKAPNAGGSPTFDASKIPAGAAAKLKSNPKLAAEFDLKYGAGASKAILGQ